MNKWKLNPRVVVRLCDSELLTFGLLHLVADKLDEGTRSAAAGPSELLGLMVDLVDPAACKWSA